jgi:predicted phosphodiesterase
MAKFLILSDIHTEVMSDHGVKFVSGLPRDGFDAIVLAGDIGDSASIEDALAEFAAAFSHLPILYVNGNHEYYSSCRTVVDAVIRNVCKQFPNVKFLNDADYRVDGVKVSGRTLWFRKPKRQEEMADDRSFSDFAYAFPRTDFKPYDWNVDDEDELKRSVAAGADLIVTHHLPSEKCISDEFKGSDLNRYFVAPVADGMPKLPKVWAFGHTHDSKDFIERGCRFVCNPYGYQKNRPNGKSQLNPDFKREFIVEVVP